MQQSFDMTPFEMLPAKSDIPHKGYPDHVDAWLMSYADLITLLFMFFVIFVSATLAHQGKTATSTPGEPEHPYIKEQSGMLPLSSPFEETYRALAGLMDPKSPDHDIAVEKTEHGVIVDMSSVMVFSPGMADIRLEKIVLLQTLAESLKTAPADSIIEIAAYTDDSPLGPNSPYANNWELSAMRAARLTSWLIQAGVDSSRLRAVSYADNQAVVPNRDSEGRPILLNRQRNQRLVIRLETAHAPLTTILLKRKNL